MLPATCVVAMSSISGVSAPAGAAHATGFVPRRGAPEPASQSAGKRKAEGVVGGGQRRQRAPPKVGGMLPPDDSMTWPMQPASAAIFAKYCAPNTLRE